MEDDPPMPSFTFQVDRVHRVTAPITLHPDPGLMSEPFTVEPGQTVVYRGVVELGGTQRHAFDLGEGRRGYSRDRAQLVPALAEDYDALMQA
jgi:hypothetical protein